MIGCEFYVQRCNINNTLGFSAIVIFVGNSAQLPPIGDVHLHKNAVTAKISVGATNRAQAKPLGRLFRLSVLTVAIRNETRTPNSSTSYSAHEIACV